MRNLHKWLLALGVATVLFGAIMFTQHSAKVNEQKLKSQMQKLEAQTKSQHDAEVENLKKQIQEQDSKYKQLEQSKAAEKAAIAAENANKAAQASLAQRVVNSAVPTVKAAGGATNASQNETIAWNFLIANGFTRNQTAGIMGNLQQEHGFNTTDVGGGLGIAQWIGGRRSALMARPNYLDINVQLQFMLDELNGSNAHAGAAVRASATIEQAVRAFQNLYERCGICNEGRRVQYAYAINARH
jgi:hypothetical protein